MIIKTCKKPAISFCKFFVFALYQLMLQGSIDKIV